MAKKTKRGPERRAPQTENGAFSARRCSLCGKTSNAKRGEVTKFVGLIAHPQCFADAQKRKDVEIVRGKGATIKKSAPADDLFEQWKNGAQIHKLASERGWKRSKVRRLLIAAAGGRDAFKSLRQTGAGGTVEPFGGKRATGGRTKEVVATDDAKTSRLTRLDARLEGWSHAWMRTSTGNYPVMISPAGVSYAQATATERADLIYESTTVGIPDVRLKKIDDSALAKRAKKESKELERGEAAIERSQKTKRERRAKRQRRKA